jgi:hypothetical protein
MPMTRALLFSAAMLAAAVPATAQDAARDVGAIWQGRQAGLGLAQIAEIAAPVFWFATDEPLLTSGSRMAPVAHPCDAPAITPVVYYQVIRIDLRTGDRVGMPPQDDVFFVDRVRQFTLRYYAYYPTDSGGAGRTHDLEALDLDIAIDVMPDGGHRIRILRAAGLVRGTEWNANDLKIVPGTKLPITMLVEHGTHAMGPDRNADGLFTPGHDINRRNGDAWGVRDVEVSSRVSRYDASMFRPRERGYRVLPPDVPRLTDGTPLSSLPAGTELGRYALRSTTAVPTCAALPADHRELRLLMRDQRFEADFTPDQFKSGWMRDLMRPTQGTNPLIRNISVRRDRGLGGALVFRGWDFLEGSLMPRVTFTENSVSLEGLFSPTSTRFLNWYVSAGPLRDSGNWNWVTEAGLKILVRVPPGARAWSLGSEFTGLRVGVRSSGFDDLAPIRFVAEIGIGGW